MISLSLYNGHNAAICILKDGEILLNWELERFTRIKHDYGFNQEFLDKSLELCGIQMTDIDVILSNRQNYNRPSPWEIPFTEESQVFEHGYAINHHLAHVASAYYTSPFTHATVATWDGGGDNENASYAIAKGNRIERYQRGNGKNIAGWWSSITLNNYRMPRLHDWDPGSGAGKIMALAAYGVPSDELEDKIEEDMSGEVKSHFTDTKAFAFNDDEDLSVLSKRSLDVAASLQSKTEKELEKYYSKVYEDAPDENLCIAGGLALNCVANTKVKTSFKNLHVPPFPNDTGLAIGMALYHWHHILDNPKGNWFSPYLGPEWEYKGDEAVTVEKVADALETGLVCICRGRSESGPRALGHRSIIGLTSRDYRDYLNTYVKRREWYRPYAPIILDKYADKVLENPSPSPYMSKSATIREEWRDSLIAVDHIDNSTRPQIIERHHDEFIYDVIEEVYRRTGVPAILNTSFNLQEPMVETPEDALKTFDKFPIKTMVLGDYMVRK